MSKKKAKPAADETTAPSRETPAAVQKTTCPKCGSAEKLQIGNDRRQPYRGICEEREYSVIIRRLVRCLGCGQQRIDRAYE